MTVFSVLIIIVHGGVFLILIQIWVVVEKNTLLSSKKDDDVFVSALLLVLHSIVTCASNDNANENGYTLFTYKDSDDVCAQQTICTIHNPKNAPYMHHTCTVQSVK